MSEGGDYLVQDQGIPIPNSMKASARLNTKDQQALWFSLAVTATGHCPVDASESFLACKSGGVQWNECYKLSLQGAFEENRPIFSYPVTKGYTSNYVLISNYSYI